MTTLEKSVVGAIGALVVAAVGWVASTTLDVKTRTAILEVRVSTLESHGDPAPHLATIDARLTGIEAKLGELVTATEKKK